MYFSLRPGALDAGCIAIIFWYSAPGGLDPGLSAPVITFLGQSVSYKKVSFIEASLKLKIPMKSWNLRRILCRRIVPGAAIQMPLYQLAGPRRHLAASTPVRRRYTLRLFVFCR